MKLSEITVKPPKIIIYGEVGSGKTALVETLGDCALLCDFDDGARTGLSINDSFKPARTSVEVKQFLEEDITKSAVAFSKFKTFAYGIPRDIQRKAFPYKALIIDSLTSFAESSTNAILSNSGKLGQAPEIQHWGLAFMEIKNVLAVLRSLPIMVILIAHEQVKSVGKGESREEKLQIAVSGQKLPNEICRFFDEIWYLRARNVGAGKKQYVIQTIGDDAVSARSRASIPNYTDTNIGLPELVKKYVGYDVLAKEVPVKT